MAKIVFTGAGSTVFTKNIIGDCMLTPALHDAHFALYDIDAKRLRQSARSLRTLNANINKKRAKITTHLGVEDRKSALRNADYVVNAIQVGGYEPSTVIDFEVPKKYGLRQTIGDTVGIGGIFRALRTMPVLLDIAHDMERVCPDAWFLNYTNPMAMLTGMMLRTTDVRTVGLCHSVQSCASSLLRNLGMLEQVEKLQWKTAGINHMGWLVEVTDGGKDLYPEIKKRAAKRLRQARKKGAVKMADMVRLQMMLHVGYYVTESSEHTAEYSPYWIKARYPELIEEFAIPLDEYPRRCVGAIKRWKEEAKELVHNKKLTHARTHEYGSYIMDAMETDVPLRIGGNLLNQDRSLISNLPAEAVVEVPCLIDRTGVQGCAVGPLPEQCAALCRTNINPQLLTLEAFVTKKREHVYHAAMLDPHTAAELSLDDICSLCDDLIEAHGPMLPAFS